MMIIVGQTVVSYLWKTGNGRTMLGDDILLRFRGPISAHEIMIKTAIFDIAHDQENLSLCCWLLLRMLYWSLVSRCTTKESLLTLRNKRRKHDYPIISSNDICHKFPYAQRTVGVLKVTNESKTLSWTWLIMWCPLNSQGQRNNDVMRILFLPH